MTDEDQALDQLREALQGIGAALVALDAVGLKPSEGLQLLGIDVPLFAGPMIDQALKIPIPAAE
jgi:hypothetical protein